MTDRGYRNLNASALQQISKALQDDPAADIEATLEKVYTSTTRCCSTPPKKTNIKVVVAQDHDNEVSSSPKQPPKLACPRALQHFATKVQSQPHSETLTFTHSIIYPLSPSGCVLELLGIRDDEHPSVLPNLIIQQVLSGKVIWENFSRAVIQTSENLVVKVTQYLDHDEHPILQFVHEHFPGITAPKPLGLITIKSTSFMFITHIPGTTLETKWPSLSPEAKAHIQDSLNKILLALRQLELPDSSSFSSPTGHHLCKDVRRETRLSPSPIYSESQFHDFILHSPSSKAAEGYKNWLRSLMRDDHRIVFTHADFHPRNIMLIETSDGGVEVSGIIDWEPSGFYPEYWEQLKALNTRSIRDTSDWWDHLPQCILGYDNEVVLDRVIEATIIH